MTGQLIHLNTAGAGLMPAAVSTAMADCLAREAATGGYETELHHDEVLQHDVYRRLGRVLGADADDLALFDSATRAWWRVVSRLDLGPDDLIWVTPYEYAGSLIGYFNLRDRTGCTIETIPLRPDGNLDLDWMAAHLSDRVALVSVTHVPSGCGIVNPVAEIGRLLAPYRARYAVDACQAVGQLPLDVAEIGCDLLTGAGRKFLCGPRGSGFAYTTPELRAALLPDFTDLHVARVSSPTAVTVHERSARTLELGERSTAVVLGLHAALGHHLELAEEGRAFPRKDVVEALHACVAGLPGAELLAPGTQQSGILSFRHASLSAEQVRDGLAARGINGWKISGDHTPLYLSARGVDTAVRLSVHHYTSLEDVEALGRALHGLR
ncbi:aminotransferase class V-fold PLP-dependent enzyme [Kitasatospora cineracea]|uniref:Selenocysteine lyase/cysteine desulfurase n=1 Tax=Kitasatospora cineracea TaxID=88074 RepID=A0A3N4RFD9_9ACTN|nr:aminotransferase class V-fold PLP-dependent enzyme [Kitasatospora cineracea]RPE29545.1 selenocysteine lyase/cysteine desulfurase [Kitasatospora cineracea]